VTAVDSSATALALHLGRLSASELDLPAELGRMCEALPSALGVAAAVAMVTEPSDEDPVVVASEAQAGWIGEAQRRSGSGPLPGVIRTGRPLHTPDLTRLGPPELAAAAAETGLTSSMALPLASGPARFGALQLLGTGGRPAHPRDAEGVRVVVEVLVARLVDVRALRMLAVPRPAPPIEVDPGDVATAVLPVVPAVRPRKRSAPVVPAPRRPQARHRKAENGV
jgi:hypothetical protein